MRGEPRSADLSLKTGEEASTGPVVRPLEEFKGGSLSSQDTEAVGWSLPWKSRRLVGWLVALVVTPTGIVGSACVGIISALIHPLWINKPQQKSEVASECLAVQKAAAAVRREWTYPGDGMGACPSKERGHSKHGGPTRRGH